MSSPRTSVFSWIATLRRAERDPQRFRGEPIVGLRIARNIEGASHLRRNERLALSHSLRREPFSAKRIRARLRARASACARASSSAKISEPGSLYPIAHPLSASSSAAKRRPRCTRAPRERGKLFGFVLQFRAGRDHSGGGPRGASSGESAIVEFDLRARLRQPPADRHSSDPGADDDHFHGRAAVRSLAMAETMEMPQERKQSEP